MAGRSKRNAASLSASKAASLRMTWREAIAERVPPKVRALNLQAYEVGREAVGEGVVV